MNAGSNFDDSGGISMTIDVNSIQAEIRKIQNPADLEQLKVQVATLKNAVYERSRILAQASVRLPALTSYDGGERLYSAVLSDATPWKNQTLQKCEVPGMITEEEARYYSYIEKFYSGAGECVELGPWLGKSTTYIVHGLADNPNFRGKALHVYDDFIWRASWMDSYVPDSIRPRNHADFQSLFAENVRTIEKQLNVNRAKIVLYDGNEAVPQITWIEKPVEMIYVDCGRTCEVNDGWWQIFSPYFIHNRTLIIMQDWRTHLEVPVKWFNQMDIFTDSKEAKLQLVHELKQGNIGTFLFR